MSAGAFHHLFDTADDDQTSTSSWVRVDLTDALAGRESPPPVALERADGVHLLYAGLVHAFNGESESLKSWAAQVACAQVLGTGGRVGYVDFEDTAANVVARLVALGVARDTIAAQLAYVRPDDPLADRNGLPTAGNAALGTLLASEPTWDLWVVDGVTESMTLEGLNLIDNADAARWAATLPRRLARTGAPVIVIDHLPKSKDNQGRYAIGAQHKLAGIDGAAYKFEADKRLARALNGEPVEGRARIAVVKDRPGWVRGRARGDDVGTLELTAWPDGTVSATVVPPGERTPPLELCRRIADYLATYEGASGRKVEENVAGSGPAIREALKWMTELPRLWVRVEHVGQSHRHYLTDEGREHFG